MELLDDILCEDSAVPTEPTAPAGRSVNGTFVKGNQLSQGRKPGSKNKSTILREKLEKKATKMLAKETPDVLQAVLQLARRGNLTAAKLVLDEVNRLHARAADTKGSGQVVVNVNIGTLDENNMEDVLSGEYERVSE